MARTLFVGSAPRRRWVAQHQRPTGPAVAWRQDDKHVGLDEENTFDVAGVGAGLRVPGLDAARSELLGFAQRGYGQRSRSGAVRGECRDDAVGSARFVLQILRGFLKSSEQRTVDSGENSGNWVLKTSDQWQVAEGQGLGTGC